MSVLINMDMPEKQTTLTIFPNGYVAKYDAKDSFIGETKAVPVPPHGRLIDADALRQDWLENGENKYVYDTNAFLYSLDDAPTIIPEEEGKG